MGIAAFILSIALMIPFLGWGIYTLRERFVLHSEISRKVQLLTFAGVVAFYSVQLILLRAWIGEIGIFFIFTALSLMVASTALYGPIFVHLASTFFVGFVHPPEDHHEDRPHFTSAEALQRAGDHEGAINEYLVMARVYPRDPEAVLKMADALVDMAKFDQAAEAFERGLTLLDDEDRALMVTNRLADVYQRYLDDPDQAVRVLEEYLENYPDGERTALVERKLERMTANSEAAEAPAPNGASELLEPPSADRWG